MNRIFRDSAAGAICCFLSVSSAFSQSCGCAASAMSLGLVQLAPQHAVGLRWQQQSFRAARHHAEVGSFDLFQIAEVWGRLQVGPRWQISTALPFVFADRRFDDGENQAANGLGDASAMGQFLVIDGKKQRSCRWQKRLQIGLGAKMPTGSSAQKSSDGERLPDNSQPGTGAADALATAFLAISSGKKGLQIDASTRVSGQNSTGFRPGGRVLMGVQAFSTVRLGQKISAIGRAGAAFDARAEDQKNGSIQSQSGGRGLFSTVGADLFSDKMAVGLNWQAPLASDFGGGHVRPKGRFQVSATCFLGNKKARSEPSETIPSLFPLAEPSQFAIERHL